METLEEAAKTYAERTDKANAKKVMKLTCPYCGNGLHFQLIDGCLAEAFCMECNRDIPVKEVGR